MLMTILYSFTHIHIDTDYTPFKVFCFSALDLWCFNFNLCFIREGCYDKSLFISNGVSIFEDFLINLADGMASAYLELISVDSNVSTEMNSLSLELCTLSTRALQRLRNEVGKKRSLVVWLCVILNNLLLGTVVLMLHFDTLFIHLIWTTALLVISLKQIGLIPVLSTFLFSYLVLSCLWL